MTKSQLSYIKRLIAYRNTHKAALRQAICCRDLIAMDPARTHELPGVEAAVRERAEFVEKCKADIASAKAKYI